MEEAEGIMVCINGLDNIAYLVCIDKEDLYDGIADYEHISFSSKNHIRPFHYLKFSKMNGKLIYLDEVAQPAE
jgi:hypothetical protein